jgi:MFS family permease
LRAQIGTLIVATSAIQLANGFFGTFFSLRVAYESFGATEAGLVLSAYFAGFTLGAILCGRVIENVGHIRTYAACAGAAVAATLAMPFFISPLSWTLLRAVIGFGCVGLFVTTESWLTAKARPTERGRIFSIYMVGTFVALAVGQIVIGRTEISAAAPFSAIAILFAVALTMVCMTRTEAPEVKRAASLPFGQLSRAAPIAVLGCMVSGIVSSAFYALIPAWMQGEGIPQSTIALFMLVAVLGGLAFQIPVGRLSDAFDRRIVLAVIGGGFAVAAAGLALLPHSPPVVLPLAAVLGGFMSTLYPVCVANAHDQMPSDRVVAVSSRLILVSGIGSVIGPLAGTGIMARFGLNGVLYLMATATLILTATAAGRSLTRAAPHHLARTFGVLTPQATAIAHDPFDLNQVVDSLRPVYHRRAETDAPG